MQIRIEPSREIRKNYNTIAKLCRESGAPVFITKNGMGNLVAVSLEQFCMRESRIEFRERLVDIEKNRRKGVKDFSVAEVRRRLLGLIENYNLLKLTEENEYPAREKHPPE